MLGLAERAPCLPVVGADELSAAEYSDLAKLTAKSFSAVDPVTLDLPLVQHYIHPAKLGEAAAPALGTWATSGGADDAAQSYAALLTQARGKNSAVTRLLDDMLGLSKQLQHLDDDRASPVSDATPTWRKPS